MITIKRNNEIIYTSEEQWKDPLLEIKVKRTTNAINSGNITFPLEHKVIAAGGLAPYKDCIRIYRDDDIVFWGRPLLPSQTYNGSVTYQLEGELAFLKDVCRFSAPYTVGAIRPVLLGCIEAYNEDKGTSTNALFELIGETDCPTKGNNTYDFFGGWENGQSIYKCITDAGSTIGLLFHYDVKSNVRRIWLRDDFFPSDGKTTFESGKNITDVKINSTSGDFATKILAKNKDGTLERMVYDYQSVQKYGNIIGLEEVDTSDVDELIAYANQRLAERKKVVTEFTASAVVTPDLIPGKKYKVKIPFLGIDDEYGLTAIEEDFLNPTRSKATLSSSILTAAIASKRKISSIK